MSNLKVSKRKKGWIGCKNWKLRKLKLIEEKRVTVPIKTNNKSTIPIRTNAKLPKWKNVQNFYKLQQCLAVNFTYRIRIILAGKLIHSVKSNTIASSTRILNISLRYWKNNLLEYILQLLELTLPILIQWKGFYLEVN